jgi:3-hydroxyacyl-CoA dehydrogenase
MADLLPEHTLIATNSSTLLARDFAAATRRPEKSALSRWLKIGAAQLGLEPPL